MPPTDALAPEGYVQFLADLKTKVSMAQRQAQRVVNTALIDLYRNIGHRILEEQERWNARVLSLRTSDSIFPPRIQSLFSKWPRTRMRSNSSD